MWEGGNQYAMGGGRDVWRSFAGESLVCYFVFGLLVAE
jgi:hypothetical protein